jgi:outer membrane protein OmpA-like peptidoglycan-associated protein
MIRKQIGFLFIFLLSVSFGHANKINALALKNGCSIIQKPSTFFTPTPYAAKINDWSVFGLLDQNAATGWCSGATSKVPYVFVFELSEDFLISNFAFNTFCQKEYKNISAKDIKVEYSMTSAKSGFLPAATYLLEENKYNSFDIAPVKARWIKLTILSNYGNLQWTELMEFEAWGTFVTPGVTAASITGVWNTNFDWVSINKAANGTIYGCYKWKNGEIYLTQVSRKTYTFAWKQNDDEKLSGWCLLVLNKEGTKMNGIWGYGTDTTKFGYWEFSKLQSTPYACSNDAIAAAGIVKKEPVKTEPKLNVMIEIIDKNSTKPIDGHIDIYSQATSVSVISKEGLYSTDISVAPYVIVKTFLPSYYPTLDTFVITAAEQKALYATRIIELSKLSSGTNILLHNVLFERTSYELLSSSLPALDQLVTVMNQYPGMIIELSGHTDNVGSAKKNMELSKNRVESAKKYLVSKGISADRIKSVGYGSKYPVASNDGEQTRKYNRRVELRIITM